MRKRNCWTREILLCAAICALLLTGNATANCGSCGSDAETPTLGVGTGLSMKTDAQAAGIEAAKAAKAALGAQEPKLVLVYDAEAIIDKAKMLEGVCSVFDASVVYGCPGYGPLTQESNQGNVGVLALGGDIGVSIAVAKTDGDHQACGERIGTALLEASKTDAPGKLLLLFGDCHVPADDDLVKGVCSVLGETFPAIGGASRTEPDKNGDVFTQGKIASGQNIGILLTGDFRCGFAMKKDNSPEGLITSARDAVKEAFAGQNPALAFVFDCGGRRGKMEDNVPKELEAIKEVAGDVPLFGFYGSGEIGHLNNGTPSRGDGFHISVCALTSGG